MKTPELSEEARYRYEERLAILIGSGPLTKEAHQIALKEALAYEAAQISKALDSTSN